MGCDAGKNLLEILISSNEETIAPDLKAQKGFKDNSVLLCPETHIQNNYLLKEAIVSDFIETRGPHAYGRIVQVPNRKKSIVDFTIYFDKEKKIFDGVAHEDSYSSMPSNTITKQLLKRGADRANIIDCRYKDKTKNPENKGVESAETTTDSVFLGGMLNEKDDGTSVGPDPGEVTNESDDESFRL